MEKKDREKKVHQLRDSEAASRQDHTVPFDARREEGENLARRVLLEVYSALKEKGYNPLNQLVGYLLSGEPAYITSYRNARSEIKKVERDELLEELVKSYIRQAEAEMNRDLRDD